MSNNLVHPIIRDFSYLAGPTERTLATHSFQTTALGAIFLVSLYFQGARSITPQVFPGGIQTIGEEDLLYQEETSVAKKWTSLKLSPPSCDYGLQETLMSTLRDDIQKGHLSPMEGTSSGAYIAYGTNQERLAIVKPVDERNRGPQNKEAARRKDDLSEEDQYQLNYYPGNPEKRQFAARRLDFGSKACQPPGYIDAMESDQFFSVEAEKAGRSAGVQRKTVYVQQFIADATPLVEFHPDFPQDLTKAYKIENNPILDQVPLEEFQKIALLDLLLYNEDRHPGNLLVTKDAEGKPHLIPIDMDMILPGTFRKTPRIGLFTHGRAEEHLTPEILTWIQALNPEQVASVIREEGLAEPLIRQGKMLALVLKELGPEHSIAEMSQFIFSKLPFLAELSRNNALKQLPPSDLESYQKSENLRTALWKKREISSEDEIWYKAYQADSRKQKIEVLLEEQTFSYFKRGLQREASAMKAQKTRHITFGTTYIAGNLDRDALSKLVSDNQQKYAKYWSLDGKVVTENLLQGQCQGLTCVPYWNKVAVLKTWLEQPSSGKEEWYVLADDDMPITNMNINPYEAIDLLREGDDASIIIARDVVQWTGGNRDRSVNTGVLIVRKDQNSKEFIEELWNKRNDVASDSPHCQTLGTCKTQDVLHEQEAFARVLSENPSFLNRIVKVVNYRNQYQGREIALNTFRRHGCFIRTQDGWKDNEFSYKDPADGAWREGDWMGQTAGVPIIGKECTTGVSRFFRLDYLRWMLERVIPIDIEISPAKDIAVDRSTDVKLLHQIQTLLGRKNYNDYRKDCFPYCSWPQEYDDEVQNKLALIADPGTKIEAQHFIDEAWAKYIIDEAWAKYILDKKFGNEGKPYLSKIQDPEIQERVRGHIDQVLLEQIFSLAKERHFERAAKSVLDIHSASIQEKAIKEIAIQRLDYDRGLLNQIQTLLGRKNYNDYRKDCFPYCSWPQEYDDEVQNKLALIADPGTKIEAQHFIDEAWAKYIIDEAWAKYILDKKFGNEGKPYLSKIQDPEIQERVRGHIDQVLLEQIFSLAKERHFERAAKSVLDIHSASIQEKAIKEIAIQRLDYDRGLLNQIQTLLGRKNYNDYRKDCFPYCSWPQEYDDEVQNKLALIADPHTKTEAQSAIGKAWTKYILDHNLEQDKDTHLANIADKATRSIAREGLEKMTLEKVKTLTQNKNFEEAEKIIASIQSTSIQKEAQQILDAGLLVRIKHLLTKTKYNLKYDASKSSDCRGCYWPEDLEQTTEKMASQISDTDIKEQAKKSIDQAWIQYRNKSKK